MSSCTSTAACTYWGTPSKPPAWPRRSAGGPAPRSSPWTTGSPPSTRIRRRSTTLWPPTKPSCTTARPLRTSPSRESPPAAGSPSPPWSTPAITGCPCPPRPSSCHRTPTSPWPGRPWTPSARPTRCSAGKTSSPGSPTTRRDTTPLLGLISPVFADLSGLPPLIIQAGTHEVLLDDAVRLARQAATADVAVTLDITPGVPHVFQAYYPILDEAAAALDRAGQLLSAHLASAERVTA